MNSKRGAMKYYFAAVVVLILSLCAAPAFAQVGSAALTGKVADASGASVAGVNVKATNEGTGIVYPTVTNDDGIYSLPILPRGSIKLQLRRKGSNALSSRRLSFTSRTMLPWILRYRLAP